MRKRWVTIFILGLYCAFLIKVMVFKDVPTIHIGHMMFNFGGTDATGEPNFIPFKTILSYLQGNKGLLIAGVNIIGNIALLVPVGILAPFVFSTIKLKKVIILAVASGFIIEGMQVLLHVGIFDIDDVMLNGLGVVIGYWVYLLGRHIVQNK